MWLPCFYIFCQGGHSGNKKDRLNMARIPVSWIINICSKPLAQIQEKKQNKKKIFLLLLFRQKFILFSIVIWKCMWDRFSIWEEGKQNDAILKFKWEKIMQFSHVLLREQDFCCDFYIQPECEATTVVTCCGFALIFVAVARMPCTSSLRRAVKGRWHSGVAESDQMGSHWGETLSKVQSVLSQSVNIS